MIIDGKEFQIRKIYLDSILLISMESFEFKVIQKPKRRRQHGNNSRY
ncbi:hypothetical protein CLOBY_27550 [Clostridium saccharobutylicum]|nr:hypothetical protein [Clostridium saccharobutylicum]AQS10610.1 hypothetical protein CLOBY_27550 [Clostridium saccharobutylicum]NSB90510.1 hypothetical protein [Clostridium saccharobutylicum]NYC31565.1 hypothetical protein [Clostridium saccharobutylicum]OOM18883.1 hypothetical protein CLSAB_03410 [Clostridium saccharobutylicum]